MHDVLLHYLEVNFAEIAEQLKIEPNAVYQALHNGHSKLRDKLHA